MGFISVPEAQEEGYIPVKRSIVGFPKLGVFTSKHGSTALCSEIGDGNLGVLNIYNLTEGTKISCGHILEDGTCGYHLGKSGETVECPLIELNSVTMINPWEQKQAA